MKGKKGKLMKVRVRDCSSQETKPNDSSLATVAKLKTICVFAM